MATPELEVPNISEVVKTEPKNRTPGPPPAPFLSCTSKFQIREENERPLVAGVRHTSKK